MNDKMKVKYIGPQETEDPKTGMGEVVPLVRNLYSGLSRHYNPSLHEIAEGLQDYMKDIENGNFPENGN